MINSINNIISIVTVFQLILFSVFLTTVRKGNKLSNLLLASFLFVNALYILDFLLPVIEKYLSVSLINFYFIGHSFGFLFGPLLYFYTKSLTLKNYKIDFSKLAHGIPFLIYNSFIFFDFYSKSSVEKFQLLHSGMILTTTESLILNLMLNIQIFIYMIISLNILMNYRKEIKKIYSSIENIKLSWLEWVLSAFIIMWFIDLINYFTSLSMELPLLFYQILNFLSLSINFVFANVIIFKGLKHPEYFYQIEKPVQKTKYEGSHLSKDENEKYLNELLNYMKTNKPYMISSLTIGELSEKLSFSSKTLSQVINDNLNQNFFDFINSYRIEEAKKILSGEKNGKTVLEILYEVGFNSKSVFNTAFKKHTGLTPTEFKKQAKLNLSPNPAE